MKYLILSLLFISTAFGGFTQFPPTPSVPVNYYGIPTISKGQLVTNNGTVNGAFSACADTEIIEWDSTTDSGFKCVTAGGVVQECQTKANGLTSSSSTGVITGWTFNNLTIGRKYSFNAEMFCDDLTGVPAYIACVVDLYEGAVEGTSTNHVARDSAIASSVETMNATLKFNIEFIATNVVLYMKPLILSNTTLTYTVANQDKATLCEISESSVITNSTKFN